MASRSDCNPAKLLSDGKSISFNGAHISLDNNIYLLLRNGHINRIQEITSHEEKNAETVAQRERSTYIAAVQEPGLPFAFSVAF